MTTTQTPAPQTFIVTMGDLERPKRKWVDEIFAENATQAESLARRYNDERGDFDAYVVSVEPKGGAK